MTATTIEKLPRSGRVRASDSRAVLSAWNRLVHEIYMEGRSELLAPVRVAIISRTFAMFPEGDIEVLRKYRLTDSFSDVYLNIYNAAHDDWDRSLRIDLETSVEVPQSHIPSFYVGGLAEARLRKHTRIIDLSDFETPIRKVLAEKQEVEAKRKQVEKFVAGYNDGNGMIRPLWVEVYRQFPILEQVRA